MKYSIQKIFELIDEEKVVKEYYYNYYETLTFGLPKKRRLPPV